MLFHCNTEIANLSIKIGAKIFSPGDEEVVLSNYVGQGATEALKLLIDAALLQNPSEKFDFLENDQALLAYSNKSKENLKYEILCLKKITFGKISLFDFYTVENKNKLATMSRNKEAQGIISQTDFIAKYAFFGKKIKENFEGGVARNKHLTTALNSFFHRNEHTKLDEDTSRMILEYLDKESLKNMTQVASLFFKFTPTHSNKTEVTETNKFSSKP